MSKKKKFNLIGFLKQPRKVTERQVRNTINDAAKEVKSVVKKVADLKLNSSQRKVVNDVCDTIGKFTDGTAVEKKVGKINSKNLSRLEKNARSAIEFVGNAVISEVGKVCSEKKKKDVATDATEAKQSTNGNNDNSGFVLV